MGSSECETRGGTPFMPGKRTQAPSSWRITVLIVRCMTCIRILMIGQLQGLIMAGAKGMRVLDASIVSPVKRALVPMPPIFAGLAILSIVGSFRPPHI